MNITENAKNYQNKFGGEDVFGIYETDPEYAERVTNFAFDEVVNHDDLDDKSRFMAVLAALMGCQGLEAFNDILPYAAKVLSPVEIKEIAYQATDYLGIGRALPFVKAVNAFLEKANTALPLEPQATTTMETRLEAGVQAQVDIFGDGMKEFYKSGADESRHINRWLAANCFGDYYTRKGLDLKQREMITFCFLSAQGGGQLLICTAGEGWYCEEGKEPVSLKPGTVITIPANVKHWHGAKKDSWFSHIAVECPGENCSTEWCEAVSDEEYSKLN